MKQYTFSLHMTIFFQSHFMTFPNLNAIWWTPDSILQREPGWTLGDAWVDMPANFAGSFCAFKQ